MPTLVCEIVFAHDTAIGMLKATALQSRTRVHPNHDMDSSPGFSAAQAEEPLSKLTRDDHDSKTSPEGRLDEILTQLDDAGWDSHSEGHPMGTNIFTQMVNLFLGVFSGNGVGRIFSYVQEAPFLTSSGVGMDCMISYMALYYTFFGIYAADHSAVMKVEYENSSSRALHVLSRSLYVFLTTHCLFGVVVCLHFMLLCGSMPLLRRRHYLIKNGRLLSLPYSAGPLSFAFIGIAFFAERAAEILRSNSKAPFAEDIILSITLFMSLILMLLGAYFGTVMVRDSMRPWSIALAKLAPEAAAAVKKNGHRRASDPNLLGAMGLPTS